MYCNLSEVILNVTGEEKHFSDECSEVCHQLLHKMKL